MRPGSAEQEGSRRRHKFARRLRVLSQADFERIRKHGRRATDGRLTMWVLPNELPHPRLGLAVGRRHGGAVQRNRIKRRLREAFRSQQHELPIGFDLVCSPRAEGELSLAGCSESMIRLAGRLAARFGSAGSAGARE